MMIVSIGLLCPSPHRLWWILSISAILSNKYWANPKYIPVSIVHSKYLVLLHFQVHVVVVVPKVFSFQSRHLMDRVCICPPSLWWVMCSMLTLLVELTLLSSFSSSKGTETYCYCQLQCCIPNTWMAVCTDGNLSRMPPLMWLWFSP